MMKYSPILKDDLNYKKYILNVILSANPNLHPDNYLVIVLYGYSDTRKRPKAKRLTPLAPFKTYAANSYIVKSSKGDHLWHVRRLVSYSDVTNIFKSTEKFMVYKVVFNVKDGLVVEQVEGKSIGDEALFLGGGHSVSVLASNFPGCKPNSIYYTNYDVTLF
ncbi:uncharacterized protein LOC112199690 [Rosa chinensis]|uniref:uncharacterized protein LOC112199690 n=1 Tax=Rosa chinensis TaxID=74649 RepID=UPI000D088B35|nr:uncharacterized protein LOC112199690 [Rosa chinensis]